MYSTLLILHSWMRWLVLASLVFAIYRGYTGFKSRREFTMLDNRARHITATIGHVQLVIGLSLYFVSPIVDYFLHHFDEGLKMREIRFFGLEHITMMMISIELLTVGSILTKRRKTDQSKFKTMLIWYSIVLFIIFCSIPWSFSPFTSRPLFRWY